MVRWCDRIGREPQIPPEGDPYTSAVPQGVGPLCPDPGLAAAPPPPSLTDPVDGVAHALVAAVEVDADGRVGAGGRRVRKVTFVHV